MSYDFEDEFKNDRSRKSRRKPSGFRREKDDDYLEEDSFLDDDFNPNPQSRYRQDDGSRDFQRTPRQAAGGYGFQQSRPQASHHQSRPERGRFQPETASGRGTAAGKTSFPRNPKALDEEGSQASERKSRAFKGGSSGGGDSIAAARNSARNAKKRKIIKIVTMVVAECLTLALIFGYAYFLRHWNRIQRPEWSAKSVANEELSLEDISKMKGYWMIAVFGVDSRGTNVGKGTNADVNMICCINRDTGEIKLVSVFRDSYLNIDDKDTYNKINQAYANGGPEQAVKALNKNLDLNITDYITFNWKAVADAINILGGVEIEISPAEFAYINSFITETAETTGLYTTQFKSSGVKQMDGVQAVAYGRLRLMDSDYARTARQRKVIEKAFEKCKQADIAKLNQLLEIVMPQVATSMTLPDLTQMALGVTKYHLSDTAGFPFAPGDVNMGKKGACVIPLTLESNVIQLHEFLFDEEESYVPTDTVKRISESISKQTGMYNEGKQLGNVSTVGVMPKTKKTSETEPATREETTEETESGEGSSSTDSSIETDEDGNLIDPPEDYESTSSTSASSPSGSSGSTSPSTTQDNHGKPGAITQPTSTENNTGPGIRPTQPPEESSPYESSAAESSSPSIQPGGNETSPTTRPGETMTPPAPSTTTQTVAPFPGADTTTANSPGENFGPGA